MVRLLAFQQPCDRCFHFPVLGVASGLLLGVDEPAVHFYLVDPSPGRDEGQLLDVRLEVRQQLLRHPDGARCVVSELAVRDADLHGASSVQWLTR